MYWGPCSELYGRKLPLLAGLTGLTAFTLFSSLSKDFHLFLSFRFLAGAFGSAGVTIAPGIFVDYHSGASRTFGSLGYAAGAHVGIAFGPFLGSLVSSSQLQWRWTLWFSVLLYFPNLIAISLLPESLDVLLLRLTSRNFALHHASEEHVADLRSVLLKPARMLTAPVLNLMTVFLAFDMGIQILACSAIPYTFSQTRGWNTQTTMYTLLPLILSTVLGLSVLVAGAKLRLRR